MYRRLSVLALTLVLAACGTDAELAQVDPDVLRVVVDGTGSDPGAVTDFWGVRFASGPGHIQSVTITVDDSGAKWDFDGSAFLDPPIPGNEPVLGLMVGLEASDMDYPRANPDPIGNPGAITFTFHPGAFVMGDRFRFSGDVDGDDPGWLWEVRASAVMSDGHTYGDSFDRVADNSFRAVIQGP